MGDWCTWTVRTSVVLRRGEFFQGMPSHRVRCRGVERRDTMGKLRKSKTFSFAQPYIILCLPCFSHIKRSWGEACLRIRAVDGLPWAFGCPTTLSLTFYACTCGLKINVMIKVQTCSAVAQLFEVNSPFQHVLSLLTNAGPVFIPVTLIWLWLRPLWNTFWTGSIIKPWMSTV